MKLYLTARLRHSDGRRYPLGTKYYPVEMAEIGVGVGAFSLKFRASKNQVYMKCQ